MKATFFLCLFFLTTFNCAATETANATSTCSTEGDVAASKLLDSSTPLAERRQIFSTFEKQADGGSRDAQYLVGSIYRIGKQLPASPVEKNLDTARRYLSNAATHGRILAMAKMAEIELSSGHYLDAMTWAQIYGHYALLLPDADRPANGYLAELVARISTNFDKTKLSEVVDDLNAFISSYDKSVASGVTENNKLYKEAEELCNMGKVSNRHISLDSFSRRSAVIDKAGFADFYVAYNLNGTVEHTWLLDSVPDMDIARTVGLVVQNSRIFPSRIRDKSTLRYGWTPFIFDDQKYTVEGQH